MAKKRDIEPHYFFAQGVVVYYLEGDWEFLIHVSKKTTPLSRPVEKFNPPSRDP